VKAWTDQECDAIIKEIADPQWSLTMEDQRKLVRAAVAEARREQRERFLTAAKDLHVAAKHAGAFEVCAKHKCVHLRESAILADKEPTE